MTPEKVAELARTAGLSESPDDYHSYWTADNIDTLQIFAVLIASAERESCAKVCDNLAIDRGTFHPDDQDIKTGLLAGAAMCAATIRARGQG